MAHQIKSPIPGTFYRRPAPDQPPYKEPGDSVAKGEVIGLIEVMKMFHEVKADGAGRITGIEVDDATPVMAGQILMVLE